MSDTLNMDHSLEEKDRSLKGWHVLSMLLGFFAVIVIANSFLITLAVRSFPGEQEKKSYLQGLAYNETLAARSRQESLGWTVRIVAASLHRETASVELTFADRKNVAIGGLELVGTLARPVTDAHDRALNVTALADGRYLLYADGVSPGIWRLAIAAHHVDGTVFEIDHRIVLN